MDKDKIVIGIDHGWSAMKSCNAVMTTGVKEITTQPAVFEDVVEYDGKYYKVGANRLEVKDTKVNNENFYILTLAMLGKELMNRGITEANVILSVGLPLTRFGAERKDFIHYLSKNKEIEFRYENTAYQVTIDRVMTFPQCYAAVSERLHFMKGKHLIVDVGSWTLDILPLNDGSPDEATASTKKMGLITCMQSINTECVRQKNGELDESSIQNVMRTGSDDILDDEYIAIIKQELKTYVSKVYGVISELGYNIETTPITFVGGGANIINRYGMHRKNIKFIEDVKANAKGYEYLTRMLLLADSRKG